MEATMYLAGDIGGTKTNLMIFSPEDGPHAPLAMATYPSDDYPSLEALVAEFLDEQKMPVEHASFGVAGPVLEGHAAITNLPWMMEEDQLEKTLGLQTVRLLNDLLAIAHAVPHLWPEEIETLHVGDPVDYGGLAVIAPGTGLGQAYLTWSGDHYIAHASEGGHTDFGPLNALEIEMLRFLQKRIDHVSYEHICSGIGIPHIYLFLKESGYAPEPDWLAERLAAVEDPTPVISDAAYKHPEPPELCVKTMEMFVSVLAAEAGNLALKVLSTGGLYLGGGIPPRILPVLKHPSFLETFHRKGRMKRILEPIPLHVILNPKVALLGAAYHGLEFEGG
jgi:glucokinase